MPDCPTCGLPYTEGAKVCPACGSKVPWKVKQKICKVCGNAMMEHDTFCSICGTRAEEEESAAEILAKKAEEAKNPTMDELYVPEITDEMLGIKNQPVISKDDMPTMDSVVMPGQPAPKPAPKPAPAPAPKPTPVITPQEEALASATVTVGETPVVAPTPSVAPDPARPAPAPAPAPTPVVTAVITPEGERVETPAAAAPTTAGYAPSKESKLEKGKSLKEMLPMILVAAIVLVILLDVFVVFRKQIFGGKDAKENTAIVTVADAELYDE